MDFLFQFLYFLYLFNFVFRCRGRLLGRQRDTATCLDFTWNSPGRMVSTTLSLSLLLSLSLSFTWNSSGRIVSVTFNKFIPLVGRLFSCPRDAETSSFFLWDSAGASNFFGTRLARVIQIAVFSLLLLLCWGGWTNYFSTSSKQAFVNAARLSLGEKCRKTWKEEMLPKKRK